MTKPRYANTGCAAGSQELGLAPNSDYRWGVNFDNGNSNNLNDDNDYFVRAVRASECQRAVPFTDLHAAMRRAGKNKQPSRNQTDFMVRWPALLLEIQQQLETLTWKPGPTTCFISVRPKAREIHAPDFADRVVHHLIIPTLEREIEPKLIYDSYSNRKGKGTHAAVRRTRTFMRQVQSGQGRGWVLKLDVKNFFNCVDRRRLWPRLKRYMERAGLPAWMQHAMHEMVARSPLKQGVVHRSSRARRALVPAYKRLGNAAPGCGLPIGNLPSQFLANVYLNALDQFVKHVLKVERYVRYVDDFLLIHEDREQLLRWQDQIEAFLLDELGLELKADRRLAPIAAGVDFLGYHVYTTHTRIRARVIHHAREKLGRWERRHVRAGVARATPEQYRRIRSQLASYEGHFSHGNAARLTAAFYARFPWLGPITNGRRRFDYRLEGRSVSIRIQEAS